jgi:thiamine biosynthesis lipoprotein
MTSAAKHMRRYRFLLLLSAFVLAACGDSRLPQLELTGNALGTTFKVVLVEPPGELDTEALESDILASLAGVDDLASTWRDDSELSAFNANPSVDWIVVSAEFCAVLQRAITVSHETDGAFDITVGPLVNLWGFGPDGQVQAPPSKEAIDAAMQNVGVDKIETDCSNRLIRKASPSLYVDLSGWAKGYAVDEIARLLNAGGLENYLIEIGGEVRINGHNSENRKWAIAVEAPSTSERVPHAVLRVTDTSVATSGDYRNYFAYDGEHYSHTIDTRTGRPVTHNLAAVTVVNPSAAYADAMATALLVLGPEAGPSLANKLEIAGYFLVRNQTGIREITTPVFDQLSAK